MRPPPKETSARGKLSTAIDMKQRGIFGARGDAAANASSGQAAVEVAKPLENLLLPAEEIYDAAAVSQALEGAVARATGPDQIRKAAVEELAARRDAGMSKISAKNLSACKLSPFASLRTVRSYAYLTDGIMKTVLDLATGPLDPTVSTPEPLTVAAVGGYGRGEMAPQSDVDLLFLNSGKITPWMEGVIETALYILWDLKMKVGHSCRSIKDCILLGREDMTIRTALLEHRFIYGGQDLAVDLHERLWKELFKSTGPEFVEAKLSERDERNLRQNGNRYLLEPNIKEGKGGLRDLQTLFWIMKYLHRVSEARELIDLEVFTIEELEKFISAESFLWAVRCHLHDIAGRPQDQLHFDVQGDVAEMLGYEDSAERGAVELFMQDYFGHATDVGELTRIFLTKLEEQHVKREPVVVGLLRSAGFKFGSKVAEGYANNRGRLDIQDHDEFLKDPLNILRLFQEALKTGLLIHPDAMRLIAANLHLIDNAFRQNPEANSIFIDLLVGYGNPERALRRMNELGVLGMFIPEFREIVAMMQFGSYHHFTVDEHTIQCMSTLAQIERGELKEDLPVASGILEQGVDRRVLYAALLLHDIGKGRREDHSKLGARIVKGLAPRLGFDENESEMVEWLVANHLLMSDTAQKRDLSDPRTVRDFARVVGNRSRLKLLTVLTVCDIRGVGPGVWNNWKAQLLRDLYNLTHQALTDGRTDEDAPDIGAEEAKTRFKEAMKDWNEERLGAELARHDDPFWRGLPTDAHVAFAKLLDGMSPGEIRVDSKLNVGRDATRTCFAMEDHPGLFARFAGTVALAGGNIVDAKAFTSSDGYSTAAFWLQDQRGKPFGEAKVTRLKKMLEREMKGEVDTMKQVADRDKLRSRAPDARRAQKIRIPTEITFDNDGSEIYTIIEVDTRDRPGLLYDLARTMYAANVQIASSVIATYGIQAVDVFYVKDMAGLKLHSQSRRDALKKKLESAIELGARSFGIETE